MARGNSLAVSVSPEVRCPETESESTHPRSRLHVTSPSGLHPFAAGSPGRRKQPVRVRVGRHVWHGGSTVDLAGQPEGVHGRPMIAPGAAAQDCEQGISRQPKFMARTRTADGHSDASV